MIVSTSLQVSAIRPGAAARLLDYVGDDTHLVSMAGDVAAGGPLSAAAGGALAAAAAANISPGVTVAPVGDLSEAQRAAVRKAMLKFASKNVSLLKEAVPSAAGPLNGLEFVFATKDAFDAFTDPNRTSLTGPLIKSARAVSELVDVLKPLVPALQNNPYIQVASLIVKFGDTAYQFHADFSAANKPTAAPAQTPLR